MIEEQNLPKAYKIDEISIITKVYPYNERVLSVNIEQDNNETEYCKCSIYSIGYIICIPCILTNICININCNVCRICE